MLVNFLAKDLEPYLPHRAPMVWVREVIEIGSTDGHIFGSCFVDLKTPSLYCPDGSIRGAMAIELCAQTFGFSKACYHHVNNIDDTPSVTYLAGVRECWTQFRSLKENQEGELRVDVKTTRKMENLTFLEGKVFGHRTGKLYAEVVLQVYTA